VGVEGLLGALVYYEILEGEEGEVDGWEEYVIEGVWGGVGMVDREGHFISPVSASVTMCEICKRAIK
jgi:hypothetical protein